MANTSLRRRLGILLLVGSGACVNAMTRGPGGDRLQPGVWGGDHAGLTVTDAGAHVELDCAFGDITQPLTIDAGGRMSVEGVYVVQRGPERAGEEPARTPARYSGRLSGDTLTFDVTLIASNEKIGSFTVVHGVPPRGIRTCR